MPHTVAAVHYVTAALEPREAAVRMLFPVMPATGQFHPLVPIARAVAAAGHEVAFASAASFLPTIEQAGFPAFPAGFDNRGRTLPEMFPGWLKLPQEEIATWVVPKVFASMWAAAMTPDLLTIARDWHPEVIVRDAMAYGGCLAAEVLGLPHAAIRTAATPSRYVIRYLVAEPLRQLRG